MQRNSIQTIAMAVLTFILMTAPAMAAEAASQPGATEIGGAWEVVGTPDASSGIPPFVNLSLFSHDGGIVNEDPSEGTALGGWSRVEKDVYAVTFYGFIAPAGLRFRVTGEVTLDASGNAFSGPFTSDVYDMQGTPLFSFSGQVAATRLATP